MKQFIRCPECGKPILAKVNGTGEYETYHPECDCSYLGVFYKEDVELIPALSIKLPWAWLIVNRYKDIENRNTLKNFRGTFLIHAGKQTDFVNFTSHIIKVGVDAPIIWYDKFPDKMDSGGIIGYAEIYDCVTKSDSPWFVGKNGLMIRNAKPLPFTPCKGKLSFFYPEIE